MSHQGGFLSVGQALKSVFCFGRHGECSVLRCRFSICELGIEKQIWGERVSWKQANFNWDQINLNSYAYIFFSVRFCSDGFGIESIEKC